MKKSIIYVLAAVTMMACSKTTTTEVVEEERVEQVRTEVLYAQLIEREISVSANLQGYLTQNVAPSVTGKIEHIYCEVGDRKSKGQRFKRIAGYGR